MRTVAAPALASSRRQATHSTMAPVLRTATPATA
jgi:hypothetical protein